MVDEEGRGEGNMHLISRSLSHRNFHIPLADFSFLIFEPILSVHFLNYDSVFRQPEIISLCSERTLTTHQVSIMLIHTFVASASVPSLTSVVVWFRTVTCGGPFNASINDTAEYPGGMLSL